MTQRFLSAAFSRRKAPTTYDPAWLNVELARLQQAMPTFIMRKLTAAGTLQPNDGLVLCDATAGSFTLTLGDPSKGSGRPVTIKKSDASGNAIILGGTIDGVTNRTLAAQDDSVVIQSDGAAWFRPMLTGQGADFSGQDIIGASLTVDTSTQTADDIVVDGKAFGSANWTTSNLTVTSNSTTAPDGTTTADTLTGTGADALVVQTLPATQASRYTVSVDLKWGNTARSQFGLYDVTGGAWVLRIEATWTAGVVTALTTAQGAGGDYVITSLGSGWYRCTGTTTNAFVLGRTHSVSIYPVAVVVGAAGSYVYAWNMRVFPRLNAITATGPVSITGPTTITGTLSVSGVATLTSQPICSSLTASQAVFTDASKGLVSVATTGTGSVVREGSPTFSGTAAFAGLTFTTSVKSTTALATPSALSATQFTAFASTVSGATLMGYGTTGDVTLKNRAGTDALIVTANTVDVQLKGKATVTGAFGCNGATAQTAYASGGALNAYVTGAFGLDSDANMSALHAMVVKIRAALVAAGVMS